MVVRSYYLNFLFLVIQKESCNFGLPNQHSSYITCGLWEKGGTICEKMTVAIKRNYQVSPNFKNPINVLKAASLLPEYPWWALRSWNRSFAISLSSLPSRLNALNLRSQLSFLFKENSKKTLIYYLIHLSRYLHLWYYWSSQNENWTD